MSNQHGQISRLGMCIQSPRQLVAFPGWGGDVAASRTGSAAGWMSDVLAAARYPAPAWVGSTPGGMLVQSREFLHSMSRYPGRVEEVWRYACDLNIGGASNRVDFTVWAAELCRNSHRGLDRGGKSGRVIIESCTINFSDGGSVSPWAGAVLFDYINGWGAKDEVWKWTGAQDYGRPIAYARLSLRVEFGTESYHDAGDGTPSVWTPAGIIGSAGLGCGYNFAIPPDPNIGFIDRENTYLVNNNPGYAQLLPAQSSVARSGLCEYIGSTASGGYRSVATADAQSLW